MVDAKLAMLETLLEIMLDNDEDLTARNVVRRAGGVFGHASDITRRPERRATLASFQARQAHLRTLAAGIAKGSKSTLTKRLAVAEQQVEQLTRDRDLMVMAVRAIIHSVGRHGGMKAWREFFPAYSDAFQRLAAIGAIPDADVLSIKERAQDAPGEGFIRTRSDLVPK